MYNGELYRKQILKSEPTFPDEYLEEVLKLPDNSQIVSKTILEDKTTDTTRIIKLLLTWKTASEQEQTAKLFFKLPVIGKQENAFDKWSCHEIDFYRNIDSDGELPIVKCHDAYIYEDHKNFLLLLEDVSDDYYTTREINRNDMVNWLNAAESLAMLHAYHWNGSNAEALKPLHGDNKSIEEKSKDYQSALEKFLPYASGYYDQQILDVYDSSLEDTIAFERENIVRRNQNNHISVVHGDSHIFNFLFPKSLKQKPIVVDFQFWRIGIPAVDVMHLIRVAFPYRNEADRLMEVIGHYHRFLIGNGVTNYSLKDCISDYQMSTAMATFGPVLNYTEFGLGHEYWGQGVYDTINNYKMAKELLNLV